MPGKGWYGPGIGPGHTGGNLGRENACKNQVHEGFCLFGTLHRAFGATPS